MEVSFSYIGSCTFAKIIMSNSHKWKGNECIVCGIKKTEDGLSTKYTRSGMIYSKDKIPECLSFKKKPMPNLSTLNKYK